MTDTQKPVHLSIEAQGMLSFLLDRYHEIKRLGIDSTNALAFGIKPDQLSPLMGTSNPCIAYKLLCNEAGFPGQEESCGNDLDEVRNWCETNGLPGLHCLAVNGATRFPGSSYPTRPGMLLSIQWRDDIVALLDTFSGEMPTGENWRSWRSKNN